MNITINNLRKILFNISGYKFVDSGYEPHLRNIITRGKIMSNKVIYKKGIESQCHYNASQLFYKNPKTYRICTGYILNDGLWRQHSWVINSKNQIIETTVKREKYFGYVMTKEESEDFAYEND